MTLTWNAPSGGVCSASGGTGVDKWRGSLSSAGSMILTSYTTGAITYGIYCGGSQTTDTTVTYTEVAAAAYTSTAVVQGSSSSSSSSSSASSSSTSGGGAFDPLWLLLLSLPLAVKVRLFYSSRRPAVTG